MPGPADLHRPGFAARSDLQRGSPGESAGPGHPVSAQASDSERPGPDLHPRPLEPLSTEEGDPPEAPSLGSIKVTVPPAPLCTISHGWRTQGRAFPRPPARPEQPAVQDGGACHSPSASLQRELPSSRASAPPSPAAARTGHLLPPVPCAHQPGPPREGAGYGRGDAHGQHLCSSSKLLCSRSLGLTGTKWLSGGEGQGSQPT